MDHLLLTDFDGLNNLLQAGMPATDTVQPFSLQASLLDGGNALFYNHRRTAVVTAFSTSVVVVTQRDTEDQRLAEAHVEVFV